MEFATKVSSSRLTAILLASIAVFPMPCSSEQKVPSPCAPPCATGREAYVGGMPFNVGQRWVGLADDAFVEDKIGITHVTGHATKLPQNPVMTADLPWEDYIASPSVIFDEKTGIYHMWYQGWNLTAWHSKSSHWGSREVPKTFKKDWHSYWIAHAVSRDGVRWEKPMLDLHPYLDFTKTNIVHVGEGGAEAPYVWLNPNPSDSSRRFLMTYSDRLQDKARGQSLMLASSADGVRWRVDNEASPLLTQIPDGSFQAIFDSDKNNWLLFRRPDYESAALLTEGAYAAVRSNGRYAVSMNEKLGPGWSYPRLVLVPDEEVERRDIDHMRVYQMGTHYIGLLGMMDDSLKGLQDVHLAVSRDGLQWTRFPYLPPLLARGEKGSFDAGQIHPAYPLDRGEFTFLFYSGDVAGQREQQGYYSSIGVARLRRGRWIGLKSDTDGGYLLTRELIVSGDRIEVNFQGIIAPYMKPIDGRPLGFIRVELLRRSDATGKLQPIPGFTMKECDPLVGDNLSGVVTWHGKADLSGLSGSPVYVRFHIVNSEFWGMRFAGGRQAQ